MGINKRNADFFDQFITKPKIAFIIQEVYIVFDLQPLESRATPKKQV